MRLPFEVELAGEGGQGVVLAAIILADAAASAAALFSPSMDLMKR
ncbi:MAG TPA: hypothetical protein PLN42_13135 [Anaerolineae bacterium]|nr:hypothetical protein [Anaerolineae bacterium]